MSKKRRLWKCPQLLAVTLLLAGGFSPVRAEGIPDSPGRGIDPAAVRSAGQRGARWLVSRARPDGALARSELSKFEVWDTVEGLRALAAWLPEGDPLIGRGLDFLKKAETPEGLLNHNRRQPGACCLETTAEYVRLLAGQEAEIAVEKARLLAKRRIPGRGWRIENPAVPPELREFPSTSAFAILALREAGLPLPAESMRWIETFQKREGDFGYLPQGYGTPFYPLCIITELFGDNISRSEKLCSSARSFILANQLDFGAFSSESEGSSPELASALALEALLFAGQPPEDEAISKGISWLLSRQREDGSWSGGYFPGSRHKNDVYCTARVLLLLEDYLTRLGISPDPIDIPGSLSPK